MKNLLYRNKKICYIEMKKFVIEKWKIFYTEIKNLLYRNKKFVTQKWKICYSSQQNLQNPNDILNALRNSCAKIAFWSSELIFTFLYAGSNIQNASDQFVCLVNFTLNSTPQTKILMDSNARFKQLKLNKNSKSDTCTYELFFSLKDRYYHLPIYLPSLLNHPVFRSNIWSKESLNSSGVAQGFTGGLGSQI